MSINQVPTGICDFLFRLMVSRKTAILRGLTPTFSQCTAAICAPWSDFARPKDEASRLPPPPPPRLPAATIKSGASVYKEAIAGNGEGEQEVGGGRVGGQASSRRRRRRWRAGHKTRLLLRGRRRSADILVQIDGRGAGVDRADGATTSSKTTKRDGPPFPACGCAAP